MASHDEQFEKYLGEFEPRRPRALPALVGLRGVWQQRLAAAAAIAIALCVSLWILHGKNSKDRTPVVAQANSAPDSTASRQRLSLVELTQMALHDPEQLDAELADASRKLLPNFRGSDSTLRVLAKE
jgi:hypothetical protein